MEEDKGANLRAASRWKPRRIQRVAADLANNINKRRRRRTRRFQVAAARTLNGLRQEVGILKRRTPCPWRGPRVKVLLAIVSGETPEPDVHQPAQARSCQPVRGRGLRSSAAGRCAGGVAGREPRRGQTPGAFMASIAPAGEAMRQGPRTDAAQACLTRASDAPQTQRLQHRAIVERSEISRSRVIWRRVITAGDGRDAGDPSAAQVAQRREGPHRQRSQPFENPDVHPAKRLRHRPGVDISKLRYGKVASS